MTLRAHRDTKPERLVERLAATLEDNWPADPMVPVTVVIGSRGMQRWLNHELATLHGSIAAVDFLFPGKAFGRAIDAIHTAAGVPAPVDDGAWTGAALHRRVIRALRARLAEPDFAQATHYLYGDGVDGTVRPRELAFTAEIAKVLERLLYDRPETALGWMGDPTSAPSEHRWLATLLADLSVGVAPDPASRLARLRGLEPSGVGTPLFVFGLSTLRPGDRRHIAELSRHTDIHLFALVPSSEWLGDIDSRKQERARLNAARTPEEIAELLSQFDNHNQLLAANGAPSRDLQLWLEDLQYQQMEDVLEKVEPQTRLQLLQRWVDDAEDTRELPERLQRSGLIDADADPLPSIEINACHGALRQCEALRDDLLRRFAADPSLEPRHVLVMTPDLATYAPLIAAVFGREHKATTTSPAVPAIPVHIADLGLTDTNPVAAVLLDVVGLVGSRVTASRLVDILGREPLRAKFGIDTDDLGALKDLVAASGLRWGWDKEDRAHHRQPPTDPHTVRFALERLALGVLMPDPGDLKVVAIDAQGLGPALPVEMPSRDHVERFGVLAEACHQLQRLQREFATPGTAKEWRERIEKAIDALCAVPESRAWQRTGVSATLQELLFDDADPAAALRFDAGSIAAMLRDAFTMPRGGDRPNTGAVAVCAMEPMRSVPFRVVAMIGMDDGSFPRSSRSPAWDPFTKAARGESGRRDLDRHLFLESLLCARDALLIYGRGFEPARGAAVPLSVVAEELADLMARALGMDESRKLFRTHPLQPWSAKTFTDRTRLPFDAVCAEAARAHRGERKPSGLSATPPTAAWPPELEPPTTLEAKALARALENAPAAFLKNALGISTSDWNADIVDREPIELDDLEKWQLRDDFIGILRESETKVDIPSLLARQRALGRLPLAEAGAQLVEELLRDAVEVVEKAKSIVGDLIKPGPYRYEVAAHGGHPRLSLLAAIPEIRQSQDRHIHVWLTASSGPGDKLLLEAWFSMLVAIACGEPVESARIVSRDDKSRIILAPSSEDAVRHLKEAVGLWRLARRSPVMLMPVFSKALVDERCKHSGLEAVDLVRSCADKWFSAGDAADSRAKSAMDDDAARQLFGSLTETDLDREASTLCERALTVWRPLLDSMGGPIEGERG